MISALKFIIDVGLYGRVSLFTIDFIILFICENQLYLGLL